MKIDMSSFRKSFEIIQVSLKSDKNNVRLRHNRMRRLRSASYMMTEAGDTHTHSEHVTLPAFPRQQLPALFSPTLIKTPCFGPINIYRVTLEERIQSAALSVT
jgi:hypothetical protein